jgi:hypothetical protein
MRAGTIILRFNHKVKIVIATGASRRFFFSFAPAKELAGGMEESLFDLTYDEFVPSL